MKFDKPQYLCKYKLLNEFYDPYLLEIPRIQKVSLYLKVLPIYKNFERLYNEILDTIYL